MTEENLDSCSICSSPVRSEFRFCPFCGQQLDFAHPESLKVPIPLGLIILAAILIMLGLVALMSGLFGLSLLVIVFSSLNVILGVLLFQGNQLARYLVLFTGVALILLFLPILVALLTALVIILYLTRPEVAAYFNQVRN